MPGLGELVVNGLEGTTGILQDRAISCLTATGQRMIPWKAREMYIGQRRDVEFDENRKRVEPSKLRTGIACFKN